MLRELERIDRNFATLNASTGAVELFLVPESMLKGYHALNGDAIPANQNPKLATMFPVEDGSVKLPDIRGRVLVACAADQRPGSTVMLELADGSTVEGIYVLAAVKAG